MCEKPKRMEAVHQPASSLFEARESMFCNRPRKRNSSGQAVKTKERRPPGYGQNQCESDHPQRFGSGFTATHTPARMRKSCHAPGDFCFADAASASGKKTRPATAAARVNAKVFVPKA